MDCKEFERLIPLFIEQKMDFMTLKRFNEHMDSCAECKEELVIQFLVTEGMQHLEEGDAFDLQGELDQKIAEATRKIKFHNSFLRVGFFLEIMVVILIVVGILWILS